MLWWSDEAIIDAKLIQKIDKFRVGGFGGLELAELIHFRKFQILLPEMELQDSILFHTENLPDMSL